MKSLKQIRQELDLSQNQLADLLGWNQSYVSAVENGRKKMGLKRWQHLAEHFKQIKIEL